MVQDLTQPQQQQDSPHHHHQEDSKRLSTKQTTISQIKLKPLLNLNQQKAIESVQLVKNVKQICKKHHINPQITRESFQIVCQLLDYRAS